MRGFRFYQKPETDGNLCAVEELAGKGDHAVDEVGFDDGAADFAFAALIRGHAAIGEDEAGHAVGREVVDEVLHPSEVGVAPGRDAILPAHVVVFAEPVGVVEGRVGEGVVGAESGLRSRRKVSACSGPKSASMPRKARFMTARRRVVELLS